MRFTVRQVGPGLDDLIDRQVDALRRATGQASREIADKAESTIRQRAPRSFAGKSLGVDSRTSGSGERVHVEIRGVPVGAWTILESGARAHPIDVGGRAMPLGGGRFATRVRHPGVRGKRTWTKATSRLPDVIEDVIEDVYDKALN